MTDPDRLLLIFISSKDFIYIIILLLLLISSAFCGFAETSMSSLNIIRVKQLSQSGSKQQRRRAKRVYKLEKRYSTVLNTILVLNNIANLAASSVVTYIFLNTLQLGSGTVVLATISVSIIIIIFAEILPKNIAKLYPEKIALALSFFLKILIYIFIPITIWFDKLNEKLEENANEERVTATEDELVEIVETIEREGVLEHNESELIKSAIKFDEITVKVVMKDKENVISLNNSMSFEDVVKYFTRFLVTRMPMFDQNGQVIGVVNQRDVFEVLVLFPNLPQDEKMKKIIKEPVYISYRRLLPDALEKAQRNAEHLLIVVDNMKRKKYLGIVTLEDILEELVGEIYDEHDTMPKDIIEIGNHIFLVVDTFNMEELFDDYLEESEMPRKKYLNVGLWVKSLFKSKIRVGLDVKYDNLSIKIIDCDEKKKIIKQVEITELTKSEE